MSPFQKIEMQALGAHSSISRHLLLRAVLIVKFRSSEEGGTLGAGIGILYGPKGKPSLESNSSQTADNPRCSAED